MTQEMILVLAVLAGATLLFLSERLRVDVVALLVLLTLTLLGLVEPQQAIAGFSNPAVVTVAAVFVLSGGLARTGVASLLGRQVLRLAGDSEVRLLVLIMSTSAFLSAFMNNVGVAALMLPVVMDIARATGRAPSRLLIPLTFSSLLGGLNTLIGTSPNILISNALADYGERPFTLFDYAPVGLAVTVAGIAYLALVGPRLLPHRNVGLGAANQGVGNQSLADLDEHYHLGERLMIVSLAEGSGMTGRTLAQSRIGSALGLSVVAILRGGETLLAPAGDTVLEGGDRLLVGGETRPITEIRGQQQVLVAGTAEVESRILPELDMTEVGLAPGSPLVGRTLREADFRQRFGLNVLAVWRGGSLQRRDLPNWQLAAGDELVVQGARKALESLRRDSSELVLGVPEHEDVYPIHERLSVARLPEASQLIGVSLRESRLGDVLGLTVLGIVRGDEVLLLPGPDEALQAGDALLLEGGPDDQRTLRGLQGIHIERQASTDLRELETDRFGLAEVVLSPHSDLAGRSLREMSFRDKYGLTVLALWREGRAYHSNLSQRALRFGDALLLYGPRETLGLVGEDPDFLLLTQEEKKAPRWAKAPVSVAIMLGVITTVLLGWLPIYIAALAGATLIVLTGCLKIDEAYRAVEWRAVVLIAGMLSLAEAMQASGTAERIADVVISLAGDLGPRVILAAIFVVTSLAAQIIPTAAVAVLLAPITYNTAQSLGLSPQALLMAVAMAASASFMSPVAHPANVMVLGPGGYRFTDYTKVGIPLTLLMFLVVMLVLPLVWPLVP